MPKRLTRVIAFCAMTLPIFATTSVHAEGSLGAYLAARQASFENDYRASATYFERALVDSPENTGLLESAIYSYIGLGEFEAAVPHALTLRNSATESQVGSLVLMVHAIKTNAWEDVQTAIEGGQLISPLIDDIAQGWAAFGRGQMTEALANFDAAAGEAGMSHFALYHKALALASVGDFESADAIFSGTANTGIQQTRRGALAHAEVLSQLGRNADAFDLLDRLFGPEPDRVVQALKDSMAGTDAVPYDFVSGPTEGMAELLYTAADVMSGEADPSYTIMFARAANALDPNHIEALLLSAGLFEQMGLFDEANETYAQIPQDDPSFVAAELGRAAALQSAGRLETATEVLQALTRSYPELPGAHTSLGDVLRVRDLMRDAKNAYTTALGLYGDDPVQWYTLYMRGIVSHDLDEWPDAEADFRNALTFAPDHPSILNYLGYSLVERNEKLDEALSMIETAVAAQPDNGAIVDSLGWVLFQLEKYDEAIIHMEHAAELEPVDPIVNDHLGDALWAVGRKIEANFQWKRALSFDPIEKDAIRIRRKLEVGLDQVREEEGATPFVTAGEEL